MNFFRVAQPFRRLFLLPGARRHAHLVVFLAPLAALADRFSIVSRHRNIPEELRAATGHYANSIGVSMSTMDGDER